MTLKEVAAKAIRSRAGVPLTAYVTYDPPTEDVYKRQRLRPL